MAATLYIMEAVNLFCGDDGVQGSKHLSLTELKLPDLTEKTADHHPGGSRHALMISGLGFDPLEATFKLNGWDPDLLSQFGLSDARRNRYTAYGVIRDKRAARAIESKAIIEARLSKITADAFTRGNLQGHEYTLQEITHYELFWDGTEKHFFDFFTGEFRVDGQSANAEERRILRLES